MIDDRDLLERALRQFPSDSGVVERVMRRRDRKRRNQRLAAGVLATIVAIAAIGTLIAAFRADQRVRPAQGRITTANVKDMRLIWHGDVSGGAATPVASGSSVYVSGWNGAFYAFPLSCPMRCTPTWTATIGGHGGTPAVAGDTVYVATGGKPVGKLYAFSTSCGTDGAVCQPLWTASIGSSIPNNDLGPIVVDGVVYIGSGYRDFGPHAIAAFPAGCHDPCAPLWTAKLPLTPSSWVVAGSHLFVGTATGDFRTDMFSGPRRGVLYEFPLDCSGICRPVRTWSGLGRIWDLAAYVDDLYVGTDAGWDQAGPGLYLFHANCSSDATCAPIWKAETTCCTRVTTSTSGDLVVAHDEKTAVYAFSPSCGTGGETCDPVWTSIVANPLYFGTPVIADGLVWIGSGADGTVSALPTDCSNYCLPLWTGRAGGSVVGVAVAEGKVIAGSDGLDAFAPAPHHRSAGGSNRSPALFYGALAIAGLAWLGVRSRRRARARESQL